MYPSRRKSGHGSANTSMTDVRKAATASDTSKHKRPAVLTRKSTPSGTYKGGKGQKDREREWHEGWDDERESFPQFCMSCEKQFVPHDERIVYCSEACRKHDQMSHSSASRSSASAYSGHYPFYSAGKDEPRDIIPRASPSRPNSTHFSPPTTPGAASSYHHTSAISALRSLSIRPPSPPSPASHPSLWPFTRSAATSPSTSYTRGGTGFFSSTYDGGYANGTGYGYNLSSGGMDRPLPSRKPGGYSRPKSIELVTPMIGR